MKQACHENIKTSKVGYFNKINEVFTYFPDLPKPVQFMFSNVAHTATVYKTEVVVI